MPKSSATQTKFLYDVYPGVAMEQKWIADLKPKTGRALTEWVALATNEGPKDDPSRRAWLKSKHKLGANSAWWTSEPVDGKGGEEDTPEKYLAAAARYVEEQYAGKNLHSVPSTMIFSPSPNPSAPTPKPAPAKR